MTNFLRYFLVPLASLVVGFAIGDTLAAGMTDHVEAGIVHDVRFEVPEDTDPRIVELLKNEHGWTATGDDNCECLYGQAIGVYDVPGGFLIVHPDSSAIYLPEFELSSHEGRDPASAGHSELNGDM